MTPEDLKRLQELEDLLEDECGGELSEMDEDDRDELKDLRSMAREEKKRAKTLAKFDKARTVFRVDTPEDTESPCFYVLDLATAQKWAGTRYSVEEVDRKTLTGKFTSAIMGGSIGDSDDFGYVEVYIADEDEVQP